MSSHHRDELDGVGPPLGVCADLYQIAMAAGYYATGLTSIATFDLHVRQLPPTRSYLVTAGLEQALSYLENIRFSTGEIDYLRSVPTLRAVPPAFFDQYLPAFRFTGDAWAIEEGVPNFPPEPILRVTAPLPEAQLVETTLLAHLGFQTSVASRAARIVEAAGDREVFEFGSRRAQGAEAALFSARAAVLGGCVATSNIAAGRLFGIPVFGTMAHSWVTAFRNELDAFDAYASVFGPGSVLLLDSYDTVAAAEAVAASGLRPNAVRLDSGDLGGLSRAVRGILDNAGLRMTKIYVSGDLDECRISALVDAKAPIDGFGVGAALSTCSDAPSLGAVYKLVELERAGVAAPIMKLSPGKRTRPGRKQVWREFVDGTALQDVVALADEPPHLGSPLLRRVMAQGRRLVPRCRVEDLRANCHIAIAQLPAAIRRLDAVERYPVYFSSTLECLTAGVMKSATDRSGIRLSKLELN